MPEMNIIVRDKIATKTDTVNYVCGNSDYVVNFDFDSEWDAYDTKTAQFNVNGKHIPVVFTGNQCKVPVITNTYAFHVGVFAGDLHTTTAARVPCKKSILCDSGAPADPPDDVYNQLMEKLDGKLNKNQGAENAGKALVIGDDGGVVPGEAQGGGSLPAMSSDTAGKMLTNDGENAEWGGAVRYDVSQQLTDDMKRLARSNINAVTVVRGVTAESQLPDIMWDIGNNSAISLSGLANFAGLHNALTKAGLSIQSSTAVFLQYITTNLPVSNIITHIFQLFTTENEQALVSVGQHIGGSHPLSNWQATKTDAYTLPVASPTQLGGVKPVAKTNAMTKGVGVDADGGLYTEPGAWYVTVTETEDEVGTADKTPQEVFAAYQAGYAVYARVNLVNQTAPYILPLGLAKESEDFGIILGFVATGQNGEHVIVLTLVAMSISSMWQIKSMELAKITDTPDIPSTLPNPNALTIKVGDTTTKYDGSAAKTVEVDGGGQLPAVTAADNGKFLRVVSGAWAAAEISSANGVNF